MFNTMLLLSLFLALAAAAAEDDQPAQRRHSARCGPETLNYLQLILAEQFLLMHQLGDSAPAFFARAFHATVCPLLNASAPCASPELLENAVLRNTLHRVIQEYATPLEVVLHSRRGARNESKEDREQCLELRRVLNRIFMHLGEADWPHYASYAHLYDVVWEMARPLLRAVDRAATMAPIYDKMEHDYAGGGSAREGALRTLHTLYSVAGAVRQ